MSKSSLNRTKVYEGEGEENRQNKVTFTRVAVVPESSELVNLEPFEIIRISEEKQLSRATVYQIRAIYASMAKMSSTENKDKTPQISIEFFAKNCPFLMTALPEPKKVATI